MRYLRNPGPPRSVLEFKSSKLHFHTQSCYRNLVTSVRKACDALASSHNDFTILKVEIVVRIGKWVGGGGCRLRFLFCLIVGVKNRRAQPYRPRPSDPQRPRVRSTVPAAPAAPPGDPGPAAGAGAARRSIKGIYIPLPLDRSIDHRCRIYALCRGSAKVLPNPFEPKGGFEGPPFLTFLVPPK